MRSRMAANESSAVDSVRTINLAEVTYATAYPDAEFACGRSQEFELLSTDGIIPDMGPYHWRANSRIVALAGTSDYELLRSGSSRVRIPTKATFDPPHNYPKECN
jgi:hypothetical protein